MVAEKYHHTLPDGQKITLPKYKHIPAGLARKARKEPAGDQIWTFLEALCSEDDLAKLDALSLEEFAELAAEWQKDSRVSQGESSASSTS